MTRPSKPPALSGLVLFPLALKAFTVLAVTVLAVIGLAGCKDKDKEALAKIGGVFEAVMPLVERDTKQVRDGLPTGAELLAKQVDADPGADPEGLRRAIEKARAGVHDLVVAKSTFFVFVDTKGVVLRSEEDPDLAAGQSLTDAVPDAKKILTGKALTEAWGSMHGLRGYEKGDDQQWLVGHPVKNADGEASGALVTGWSLRRYAEYLETHARQHLDQAAEDKTKSVPLLYVFVVKGTQAYGGKMTPDLNAQELSKLDLVTKAKAGEFQEQIVIEERKFFVTARPAPSMADDVAIALMISPV
jgi:hypothetical protein